MRFFFFSRLYGSNLPDGSVEQRKKQVLHEHIIMFSNFVSVLFVMSPSIHFVLNISLRFVWDRITAVSQSGRVQGSWRPHRVYVKVGLFFPPVDACRIVCYLW